MVNDQRTDAEAKAADRRRQAAHRGRRGLRARWPARSPRTPPPRTSGGDLGYFGRNRMVKEFEDAAFGAQPGQLVGPVKSALRLPPDRGPGEARRRHPALRGGEGADPGPPRPRERARTRSPRPKAQRARRPAQGRRTGRRTPRRCRPVAQKDPTASPSPRTGRFARAGRRCRGLGLRRSLHRGRLRAREGRASRSRSRCPRGWAVLYRPGRPRAAGARASPRSSRGCARRSPPRSSRSCAMAELQLRQAARSPRRQDPRPGRGRAGPRGQGQRGVRRPGARSPESASTRELAQGRAGARPGPGRRAGRRRPGRRAVRGHRAQGLGPAASSPGQARADPHDPGRRRSSTGCSVVAARAAPARAGTCEYDRELLRTSASRRRGPAPPGRRSGRTGLSRMIGYLQGNLLQATPGARARSTSAAWATRSRSRSPPTTRSRSGAARAAVALFIHTHVREDGIALFGFWTEREKQLFEQLIAVSGIGPRLARVVLSGMAPDDLIGGDRARRRRPARRPSPASARRPPSAWCWS